MSTEIEERLAHLVASVPNWLKPLVGRWRYVLLALLINLPGRPISGEPFHEDALETHDILKAAGLEVDVIPEPNRRRVRSADFVASYVNYYVCNGGVIAPQFGDSDTDAEARRALRRHYPGREVVTLNTDTLGQLGGGIHCATQQMPAA